MNQSPEPLSKDLAPVVSVIIPTYKHRDFIWQTLESVWVQTFRELEIIVIDDGSPDDTAQMLRPLAQEGRIRLIEQPNAGQAAARNKGIEAARGEFVALLDDDDLWPSDKLQWQVEALRARPEAVLAYGYTRAFGTAFGEPVDWISPHENAPQGQVRDRFVRSNPIMSPGQALIRADVLHALGGLDLRIWGADDWDLYIRLAARGEFVYEHRLALFYRYHESNASRDARRMNLNARRVLHKHLGRYPYFSEIGAWLAARRFIRNNFYETRAAPARAHGTRGDWSQARALWLRALMLRPVALCDKDTLKRVLLAFSDGRFPPKRADKSSKRPSRRG